MGEDYGDRKETVIDNGGRSTILHQLDNTNPMDDVDDTLVSKKNPLYAEQAAGRDLEIDEPGGRS